MTLTTDRRSSCSTPEPPSVSGEADPERCGSSSQHPSLLFTFPSALYSYETRLQVQLLPRHSTLCDRAATGTASDFNAGLVGGQLHALENKTTKRKNDKTRLLRECSLSAFFPTTATASHSLQLFLSLSLSLPLPPFLPLSHSLVS